MLRFPPLAVLFSSLVLGLFVGCAPDDSDLPEVAIATCEEVINNEAPGDEAPVDFMPGVEEELAAADLGRHLTAHCPLPGFRGLRTRGAARRIGRDD